MGELDLSSDFTDWIQPQHRWTALLYLHSGVAFVNSLSISFVPGEMVIFPPGSRGSHGNIGPGTTVLYATFDLPGDPVSVQSVPIHCRPEDHWVLRWRDVYSRTVRGTGRGRSMVWDLMWHISTPRARLGTDDRVADAEQWIRQNLARHFSVTEVAQEVGVQDRTLLRLFRTEHGTTIKGYVLEIRAREATRLLLETDLPIKVVATRVGVPDLQQFNKLMRTVTGLSPRKLRESHWLEGHREGAETPSKNGPEQPSLLQP